MTVQSKESTEPLNEIDESMKEDTEDIVEFVGNATGDAMIYASPRDPTFSSDNDDIMSIQRFLERPILLNTYSWYESSTSLITTLYPWYSFLNDTRVKNKIHNYAFAKFDLHLKFVLNASPFYYGCNYVYYTPMSGYIDQTNLTGTTAYKIPASQRPGVFLEPQKDANAEMVLPYINHQNWLDITSASALQNFGRIDDVMFAQLMSANGATTNGVTVSVFAWASNVELCAPTVKLAVQSKETEYVGQISTPASAIAKFANYLTDVPIIGVFAKATEMGASAVASIAKLFGYTNVPVISDVMPFKSLPFHAMASAHISEPVNKLSLDPKMELTIDPRTIGLDGTDELAVRYIASKRSYLTTLTWNEASAADTLLFNSGVCPMLYDAGTPTSGVYKIGFTPMAYISMLFGNWRGDVTYTFKIVASKYHRGRLRFTWDPVGDIITNGGNVSTNVTFTKIVDISEDNEIKITIPYLQIKNWCNTLQGSNAANVNTYQLTGFTNLMPNNMYNGQLTVRVQNNLSAPIDVAPVQILVFVEGGDNLEFANNIALDSRYSYFQVQSKETTFSAGSDDDTRYLLNYGEAIPSIRNVLRRSSLSRIRQFNYYDNPTNSTVTQMVGQGAMPVSPGYDPNADTVAKGIVASSSTFNYAITKMHPISWMQGCYIGKRGSVKWTYNLDNQGGSPINTMSVDRMYQTRIAGPTYSGVGITDSANTTMLRTTLNTTSGQGGMALTNQLTQTGLSVEMPQMSPYRFVFSKPSTNILGYSIDETNKETFIVTSVVKNRGSDPLKMCTLYAYASIGTDFNYFFFLNAPLLYWCASNPGEA